MAGLTLWHWASGRRETQLEATLIDPSNIPGLHGLVRVTCRRAIRKTEQLIKRIESVEPNYPQLAELKDALRRSRRK
jgi:hypothetical protein